MGWAGPSWGEGPAQARSVEEHQGFFHSHMLYGSCQLSEGLYTRLLKAHRDREQALGKVVIEAFVVETLV